MTQSLTNGVSDTSVEDSDTRQWKGSNAQDKHYHHYLGLVQEGYEHAQGRAGKDHPRSPLFTTDAKPKIWEAYLSAFPQALRAYSNCSCCRRFLQRYGTLATITETGAVRSALFNPTYADADHREAHAAVDQLISQSKITGVFINSERRWGSDNTGNWVHYAITPYPDTIYPYSDKMRCKKAAEYSNGRTPLAQTLALYPKDLLAQVIQVITAQPFSGAEKAIGQFRWLHDLHVKLEMVPGRRDALLWRAIATAPAGFLNIKDNAAGTLLDDLKDGLDFDHARRKFLAKIDPLVHQRAQVAPKAGNIKAAEEIVRDMGIAKSLERRLARPDELKYLWQPAPVKPADYDPVTGVFAHIKPKDAQEPVVIQGSSNATVITWDRFRRQVLPMAESMEVLVGAGLQNFMMFTTAVHAEAPPILQWDQMDKRNPVAYYQWVNQSGGSRVAGSPPHQHGLVPNTYVRVTGITLTPQHWEDETAHGHHPVHAIFILADGKETLFSAGCALFPADLRNELHGVRATIEAFSKSMSLEHTSGPYHAVGLRAPKMDGDTPMTVIVTAGKQKLRYLIDRWE